MNKRERQHTKEEITENREVRHRESKEITHTVKVVRIKHTEMSDRLKGRSQARTLRRR